MIRIIDEPLPATTLSLNLLIPSNKPLPLTYSTKSIIYFSLIICIEQNYCIKFYQDTKEKETRTACLSEKNIPIEDNAPAHSISGSFVPSTCCKSVYVFSRVCRMRKLSAILTDIRYSKTMPLYLSPTRLIESSFRAKALVLPLLPPHTPPPPARKTLVLPIEGEERNACRRKDEESSVRLSLPRFRSAARTSRMGGYPTRWIFWLRASYVIHHSSLFNQVFLGFSRKGTISES